MEEERSLETPESQEEPTGEDILGEVAVAWEVDEYPRFSHSKRWYLIVGGIALLCLVYSILTANFLFAVIVLMGGVLFLTTTLRAPKRIVCAITEAGFLIDQTLYDYREIKDFSLVYRPPEVKILYLNFRSFWHPLVAIPLEDTDPNLVRQYLLSFCTENLERTEETLTDTMRRVYKL